MTAATAAIAGNLVRWEWFRLRQRVGFWVILAIVALVLLATVAVSVAMQEWAPAGFSLPPHGFPFIVFLVLSRLGPLLAIVLAAMLFGEEFSAGTWRPLLARGTPKQWAIHPKLALGIGIILAVWLIAWFGSASVGLVAGEDGAGAAASSFIGVPDGWGMAALGFASGFPPAVAYLALGALLCVVGRSSAFGVGVGMAIVIGEAIVYPLANTISDLSLDISLSEYTRWTLWGVTNGINGQDEWNAAIFLPPVCAYIALFWSLAVLVMARRDVGSGRA